MSNTQLQKKFTSFKDLMLKQSSQIKMALPRHIDVNRIMRAMMTELRNNPKLLECDQKTLLGCLIKASQWGLEIGSTFGYAYLVPYKRDVNLILGYKGMIELAYRSERVLKVSAHIVYENDQFDIEYGTNERLIHKPALSERGNMLGAYAMVFVKDADPIFVYMSKSDIDSIKARSQAASSKYSPWQTDYPAMARKTVVRQVFKWAPKSIEISEALTVDESSDVGNQDDYLNTITIDAAVESDDDNAEYNPTKDAPKSIEDNNEESNLVADEFFKDADEESELKRRIKEKAGG